MVYLANRIFTLMSENSEIFFEMWYNAFGVDKMNVENKNSLYEAFCSKEKRLDGKYFMGVSSTGIYCRPVCSAKMPKKENCSFYKSAAEAEINGFRPCMICRPELAPGNAKVDSSKTILKKAIKFIDDGLLEENNLHELSKKLNISDRHLRRIFKEELNITPIDYIQTSRLLLAKNLLTDTNLSISDIAFASGFKSLRRFNDCFKENYKIPPSHFRKENVKGKIKSNNVTIKIGYNELYNYEEILKFLKDRIIRGTEKIEESKYYKTLFINKNSEYIYGFIVVANNRNKSALEVTMSESLVKVLPQVINIVKNIFDLNSEPYTIYDSLKDCNNIIKNCYKIGTRIPGTASDFEACIRAIVGQLISTDKAKNVLADFCKKFGNRIETKISGLYYVFPTPESIANIKDIYNEICPLHITRTKADAIASIANGFKNNEFDFKSCLNTEDEINRLLNIKGIGKWTAEYIAIRAMNDTDILLDTDYGIKKILYRQNIEDKSIFDKYSPYRSYLTIGLWNLPEEEN